MKWIHGIVLIFAISLFIAGVIKLTVPLPLKAIIFSSATFLCFLFVQIDSLFDCLVKILYFQRVSYIAIEKNRLDPNDNTPAREILSEDVKEEIAYNEIEWNLGGRKIAESFSWGVYIVAVVIVTIIALYCWP